MSRTSQTTLSKSFTVAHGQRSKEDSAAFERIDAQLERLGERSIIQKQPYLLSVPSEVPYRHSSRFVNTWYVGTPFTRHEEQLQYMSFLPHQGDHESLLHVVGGWSDDTGNVIDDTASPQMNPTSGHNTPVEGGPRKKISLRDYKTKDKLGTEPVERKEQPRDLKKQEMKVNEDNAVKSRALGSVEEKNDINREDQGKKRTRDGKDSSGPRLDNIKSPVSANRVRNVEAPPEKKRKIMSSEGDPKNNTPKPDRTHTPQKVKDMPKLLSPTLPSFEKKRILPGLLLPKLPPVLVKAARSPSQNGTPDAHAGHQRTETVRSFLASAGLDNSPVSNEKSVTKPGGPDGGSRFRSDSQHSNKSTAPAGDDRSPLLKSVHKPMAKLVTPQPNNARFSPGPRQRHIICLKYGKKNRKRVEALLKFAARPKKILSAPTAGTQTSSKPKMEQSSSKQMKVEHKRPTEHIVDSPPEKKKSPLSPPETSLKPSTPVPVDARSPPATTQAIPSQPRPSFSTPKKDMRSMAMRRIESTDGADARTPSNDRARTATPLSVDRSSTVRRTSPAPTSHPASRDDERTTWTSINTKYFALGRTIKHEGTSCGPSPGHEPSDRDSALSVVLLIEALICFMINNSALSFARPNADPGWSSMIPYHVFVFRASRKFPHLHGLVVQLGAVCRQYIHKYEIDRLARDPLPDEQFGSAPTPGSDGNTKTNDDGEKYKKRYLEFRDGLIRNARELQTAWLDGSRLLSTDLIEREYPRTWAKRAKDSSLRTEKPNPSKIPKDYFLPLNPTTTAFEAMRFSLAFLVEWTEKEHVEWKTKIEL